MAGKVADIAFQFVHQVVEQVAQGQHACQFFVLVNDDEMAKVMLAHERSGGQKRRFLVTFRYARNTR